MENRKLICMKSSDYYNITCGNIYKWYNYRDGENTNRPDGFIFNDLNEHFDFDINSETFNEYFNEVIVNPDQTLLDENERLKAKLDDIKKELLNWSKLKLDGFETVGVMLDEFFPSEARKKAQDVFNSLTDEVAEELKKLLE